MALIVEDGTVVANAESYISAADADTYFTEHGSPAGWTGDTVSVKEPALRYATAWLDSNMRWRGVITDEEDQVLGWPRYDVRDNENRIIATNIVPQIVKDATCEMALAHLDDVLNEVLDRETDELKLGPLEIAFKDSSPRQRTFLFVLNLLKTLTEPRGVVRIDRG